MITLRQRIGKLLFAELLIGGIFSAFAGYFAGLQGCKSAVLGGLAYFLPNAYRSYSVFRYQGARAARLILKGFYKGEMVKFLMSVLIFAGVFAISTVNPMIFFGTYIGMQMLVWFAPLLITVNVGK